MSVFEVTIPGRPPSPNDHSAASWHATRKIAKKWRNDARLLAQAARPSGWHPLGRAVVTVLFIVPDHGRRDIDNLVAGAKPLQDGLVDAGILLDDSTAVIVSIAYSWSYRKGISATVFRVEGDAATVEMGL